MTKTYVVVNHHFDPVSRPTASLDEATSYARMESRSTVKLSAETLYVVDNDNLSEIHFILHDGVLYSSEK